MEFAIYAEDPTTRNAYIKAVQKLRRARRQGKGWPNPEWVEKYLASLFFKQVRADHKIAVVARRLANKLFFGFTQNLATESLPGQKRPWYQNALRRQLRLQQS